MKKRSISLVELLIALGLLSLLLSTLFFWYRTLTTHHAELNRVKGPVSEERYAFQRLQKILPKAEKPFFQSDNNSLVFMFDRGVTPEPFLSGKVLARLYYEPATQSLKLGIWPDPKKTGGARQPTKTLLLLDRVKDARISYYHPPDPFKKPVSPEEVRHPRPIEDWQGTWLEQYEGLPAMIKVTIQREECPGLEGHEMELCFDLMKPIAYPKDL